MENKDMKEFKIKKQQCVNVNIPSKQKVTYPARDLTAQGILQKTSIQFLKIKKWREGVCIETEIKRNL